jgi:hypothetical protein
MLSRKYKFPFSILNRFHTLLNVGNYVVVSNLTTIPSELEYPPDTYSGTKNLSNKATSSESCLI